MTDQLQWIDPNKEPPKAGQRIMLMLSDGRVCSGRVTEGLVPESLGFEIEYIDSLDLAFNGSNAKWFPLNETQS